MLPARETCVRPAGVGDIVVALFNVPSCASLLPLAGDVVAEEVLDLLESEVAPAQALGAEPGAEPGALLLDAELALPRGVPFQGDGFLVQLDCQAVVTLPKKRTLLEQSLGLRQVRRQVHLDIPLGVPDGPLGDQEVESVKSVLGGYIHAQFL